MDRTFTPAQGYIERRLTDKQVQRMITNLRLQNYKNHRDTEFEFGRLTAIVGPNSSGKTNALEVLKIPRALVPNGTLSSAVGDEADPSEIIMKFADSCEIKIEGEGSNRECWMLDISMNHDSFPASGATNVTDTASAKLETSTGWKFEGEGNSAVLDGGQDRCPDWLESSFEQITFLQAIGRRLQQPSFTNDIPPKISSHGDYLPTVIAHYQLKDRTWVDRLIDRVQTVVPVVRDINIQQSHGVVSREGDIRIVRPRNQENGNHIKKVDQLIFDFENAHGIRAQHVSEGTLFATLIFAALMQYPDSDAPKTLLLDDIDQGLHPKAQRDLIRVLRNMVEEEPDLQVIFSTHSPYVVDEMDADEVYLLNTDKEGAAHAKKLSEHPDADRALEVLTTGEFWSAEGEDWVVSQDESA